MIQQMNGNKKRNEYTGEIMNLSGFHWRLMGFGWITKRESILFSIEDQNQNKNKYKCFSADSIQKEIRPLDNFHKGRIKLNRNRVTESV